jgi:hypothetical protein
MLLEWEGVEHHLLAIFSALVRGASPEVRSEAFHPATIVRTRLTMIDAAAKVFLPDGALYLEWKALSDRVSAAARSIAFAPFASAQNTDAGYELPNEVYDLKKIRQWRKGIRALAAELQNFLARVENAVAIAGAPPRLSAI